MKTTTRKLRSPLKWHGGKSYLARRIVALFPPHRVYVEPFIGGGSVLLNKPPAEVEVAGDMNPRLIEFWWSLQGPGLAPLCGALSETEYTAAAFEEASDWLGSDFGPKRVVGFVVRNRMSRGGLGKDFAWSDRLRGKTRPGGPVPGDVNAWNTFLEELPAVAERVRSVGFLCRDALSLIASNDAADALIYCDPPYLHETRTVRKAYEFEMSAFDHAALLRTAAACRGKVFISGYRSDLYDSFLAGWARHEFDMPNHSGQGATKQRRVECLWESPGGCE